MSLACPGHPPVHFALCTRPSVRVRFLYWKGTWKEPKMWYWGLKWVLQLRAVQGVGFEGLGFLATQPGWDVSGFGNEVDKLRGEVQLYLLNCWGKESCLQLEKLSGLWPKWWASSFDPTLSSEVGRDAYCNGYRGHGLKPTQGLASHVTLFVGLPKAIRLSPCSRWMSGTQKDHVTYVTQCCLSSFVGELLQFHGIE